MDLLDRVKAVLPDGQHELLSELGAALGQVAELEQALGDAALAREALAAERDAAAEASTAATAELERVKTELGTAVIEGQNRYAAAVAKYRQAVLAARPELPAELIVGEDLEAIDRAVETATAIVEGVKERVRAQLASQQVPNGAPARTGPDLEAMSPGEKIALGLRQKQS